MSRLPPAVLVVVLSACGAPTAVVNVGVDPGAPRCSFYDSKVNSHR